jgi:hypothetical protein
MGRGETYRQAVHAAIVLHVGEPGKPGLAVVLNALTQCAVVHAKLAKHLRIDMYVMTCTLTETQT